MKEGFRGPAFRRLRWSATGTVAAGSAGEKARAASSGALPRTYDIRLQRERVHRRIVVSMIRRFVRVIALHGVDAALLAGVVHWLSRAADGSAGTREFAPAIVAIYLLSLNATRCYQPGDARRDWHRLFSAVLMGGLILGCFAVFAPRLPFSAGFLAMLSGCSLAALVLGRTLIDQAVRQVYLRGFGLRRALLIGNLDEVSSAIQQLRDQRNIDQYLVGHMAPDEEPDPAALGVVSDLPQVLDEEVVQEVIIATSLSPNQIYQVANGCFERGIVVYVFPTVVGSVEYRTEPQMVGSCALLHLFPMRFELPTFFMKRAFDLVGSILLLIVLAPLMALIALAICLDSRGPVFFRQVRVGLGGRHFRIWKFRSMAVDADDAKERLAHLNTYADARLFKLPNDPRITRVGRFLRRSSLDELPQLLNVLVGEMSLVGPRPPLPSEVARYEPHHLVRLAVTPGMTGPWQVSGRNQITDFEEVVRLERSYVHSWSLLLDLKILLRTINVVVRGEGAY